MSVLARFQIGKTRALLGAHQLPNPYIIAFAIILVCSVVVPVSLAVCFLPKMATEVAAEFLWYVTLH